MALIRSTRKATALPSFGGFSVRGPGADGWTAYPVSAVNYYVDSGSGLDTNPGTQNQPLRTLSAAHNKLAAQNDATIFLKRGTSYPWFEAKRGGISAAKPLVYRSWGSGARPKIQCAPGTACIYLVDAGHPAHNVWLMDLELEGDASKDSIGINQASYINQGMLVEGCKIHGLGKGVVLRANPCTVRRNVIHDLDTNDASNSKDGTGIYADNAATDNLVLEENVILRAGHLYPEQFKHGIYLQGDIGGHNIIVRNNVIGRCSQTGIMVRAWGEVLGNVVFRCGGPGLGYGGLSVAVDLWDGAHIISRGNVVTAMGSKFATENKGWGMALYFIRSLFSQLDLIVHHESGTDPRTVWIKGTQQAGVNGFIHDALFDRLRAYNFLHPTLANGRAIMVEGFPDDIDGIHFARCNLSDAQHTAVGTHLWEDYAGLSGLNLKSSQSNLYTAVAGDAFKDFTTGATFDAAAWFALMGDTLGTSVPWTPADPTRTLAAYDAYLGGPGTIDDLETKLLNQSRDNWDERLSAQRIGDYFHEGYDT